MAPMPLQQGDPPQIGRYRLTARLGAGGMGVVYLGDAGDGQQVAVKVLRPEYADDQEFRARFRREVSAMGRVRNRYCVRVLDADTDSHTPFLVTEFAEGPSLDEHVKAQGPLHADACVMLASAMAEAIAAIHDAGVTHRDLKPSNVLLTNSGPKVIDFGIAQTADSVSITRTGMAIGSPGYMAPEQVTGRAGREADIFTWALIVSFAASGRPPFGTGETVAILHRIMSERPDISAVPPQLMPLVQAALQQDPNHRPAAAELLQELTSPGSTALMVAPTAVDRQIPTGVRTQEFQNPGGTRTMPGDPGPGYYDDPGYGPGWPRRRSWRGPAAAAAVVVAVLGIGAWMLTSNGSQGNTPGGQTPTISATNPGRQGAGQATRQQDDNQGNGDGVTKKHKRHSDGTGTGNNNGGTVPTTAPSIVQSLIPTPTSSG